MAQVTLSTEWDAAWDANTVPFQPDFPDQKTKRYQTQRNEFELGYIQTFSLNSKGRRVWQNISWSNLNASDASTLMTFLTNRNGSEEGFKWTPPDYAAIQVHAINPRITKKQEDKDVYTITCDLEELF